MPVREVTDPAILEAFGLGSSTGQPVAPSGTREVTDPAVLSAFGLGPEARPEPETVNSGQSMGTFGGFVSGLSSDETETVRWMASQLYPDEPIEKAASRFGKKDGHIYHVADDGQAYWANEGFFPRAAKKVAESAPMVAGAAAGMVTAPAALAGPLGLAGSMAATGGAAAATEAGRQALGDLLMGDASTEDINPWSIASEGATNALGQGIGAGIGTLATRGAVRDIAKYDKPATQQAYKKAAAEGVDITPAEATGLPTLAAQQKRLGNITSTSDKMAGFQAKRNTQVVNAWQKGLDAISKHADAEDVGKLARDTADDVLKGLNKELQKTAKPFYDKALDTPIKHTDKLDDLMKRPAIKDAWKEGLKIAENEGLSAQKLIESASKEDGAIPVPNMRGWHYIKIGLGNILDSGKAQNAVTGARNSYGHSVNSLRKTLLGELDAINPDYAKARNVYAGGVDDVSTAVKSALGTLSKTKDTSILTAARTVFDPKTRSPQMVGKLRHALEKQNPEAWQALKRLYMQDVTTDALKITEAGEVANPAGKLFKAFSNPKVQANLRAAMTDGEYKNMKNLLEVYRRAASVSATRSDTAWNQEIQKEAAKAARPLYAKAADNLNPAQALKNFVEWRTEANLTRQAEATVDLVTSGNPKAIETMKELRQLSPNSKRFAVLFGHLIGQSTVWGASQALPEADTAPGDYAE